jgi:hypothetical protein
MSEICPAETSQMRDVDHLKYLHEIMFSFNVGLTGTIMTFRYAPDLVVSWLYRTDSSIQASLHLRQTDLATNYFVFFILSFVLAFCAWGFLRVSSRSRQTKEILLLPVAGFFALGVLPATTINPWNNTGAFEKIVWPLEILFVLYMAFQYLHGGRPQSAWIFCVIIAIHFGLWSREFGPYDAIALILRFRKFHGYLLFVPGGVPIAWTVACSSALVWALYVRRLRQTTSPFPT